MLHSAIVVDNHDNVATALQDLADGEPIRINVRDTQIEIILKESMVN